MRLTFYLLTLGLSLGMTAQRAADITDGNTEYDKKTLPSLILSLEAPVEAVYEPWQAFWEERYAIDIDRADKDRNSIAYLASQVSLPGISDKNLDLYTNVYGDERGSQVALSMAFSDTDVVDRNKYPSGYTAARAVLEEFRTYFYTGYFDRRQEEVAEALEEVRDDSQDASKDAQKARSQIEKYEKKIEKLRRKIEDTREEVGDELQTAEEKATRVRELEDELRTLQVDRRKYLG